MQWISSLAVCHSASLKAVRRTCEMVELALNNPLHASCDRCSALYKLKLIPTHARTHTHLHMHAYNIAEPWLGGSCTMPHILAGWAKLYTSASMSRRYRREGQFHYLCNVLYNNVSFPRRADSSIAFSRRKSKLLISEKKRAQVWMSLQTEEGWTLFSNTEIMQ
jgi:hypothetical protein